VIIFSFAKCQQTASERVEQELKNHLQPKDSIINTLSLGKTFALESSERQGIDQERFKEFDYWKEIDTNYFHYVTSKEFSNPDENGGISTTIEIQKAIKKGYTEVKFYKRKYYGYKNLPDTTQKDTAQILYNTYKFNIE